MAKKNQDFEIWAGNNLSIIFTVKDASDLSDIAAIKWAFASNNLGDVILEKQLGSGIGVSGNQITVTLAANDTKDLQPGYYYHELKAKDTSDNIFTIAIGIMQVNSTIIES